MKIPSSALHLVTSALLIVAGPLPGRTETEMASAINNMSSTPSLQHGRNYSDTSKRSFDTSRPMRQGLPVDENGFVRCGLPDILPDFEKKVHEQEKKSLEPNIDTCSNDSDVQDEKGLSSPLCVHSDVVNMPRDTLLGFYVPDNATEIDRKTKLLISLVDT